MVKGWKAQAVRAGLAVGLGMTVHGGATAADLTITYSGTISYVSFPPYASFDPAVTWGADAVVTFLYDIDPDTIELVEDGYFRVDFMSAIASLSIDGTVIYSVTGAGQSQLWSMPYGFMNHMQSDFVVDDREPNNQVTGMAAADLADSGWSGSFLDAFSYQALAGESGVNFTMVSPVYSDRLQMIAIDVTRVTGSGLAAAAVPEPATWAMMIAGFGLVGGAVRRRRPSPDRAAAA